VVNTLSKFADRKCWTSFSQKSIITLLCEIEKSKISLVDRRSLQSLNRTTRVDIDKDSTAINTTVILKHEALL